MKYPVISLDETERLCSRLLEESDVNFTNAVKWMGSSPEIDLLPLESVVVELHIDLDTFLESGSSDKDAFEGVAAGKLHAALADLPLGVLDDPGFWRYVSIVHLWSIVLWREKKTFDKEWTKYRVYVDGRKQTECVALRMFLRGQIALVDGDYTLASKVPEATDFWRSHIVRVRTSYSPKLAHGLVRAQAERRMSTDVLREYAKKLQRVSSNVVLRAYDDDHVAALLADLRDD